MIIPSKHSGYVESGRVTSVRRAFLGGGDKSAPAYPTNTTNTTTSIPDYAKPYVEDMLGQSWAMSDLTNPNNQYQTYTGERQAQFTPLQQQSYDAAQNMQPSAQLDNAASMTGLAGLAAYNTSYAPNTYSNQYSAPSAYNPYQTKTQNVSNPSLQMYNMQRPTDVTGATMQAAQMSAAPTMQAAQLRAAPTATSRDAIAAQLGAAPLASGVSFSGPAATTYDSVSGQSVSAPTIAGAQTDYGTGGVQQFQMQNVADVNTERFPDNNNAETYMSPYMQQVVEQQQRDAERQAEIATTVRGAQAVGAGAYGGSRQAIMDAEAAKNLAQQKGDIQSTGLQRAYEQAQAQFTADQARKLQAAQGNQQAGLTTNQQNLSAKLGVQQLSVSTGLQTALANLTAEQQTQVQNAANALQASGMTAENAMRAALANQSAGMNTQQFNATQQFNTANQNAQLAQQTALANQAMAGQYGLANAGYLQQAGLQNASLGTQANLANQAMAGQYGLQQGQFNQAANAANQALAGQYGLQQGQFNQAANAANAGYLQQANLANQQTALTTNQQNLLANLGVQQLGSGQNMQAQLANQQNYMQAQAANQAENQFRYNQLMNQAANAAQYGQARNQLNEQSQQYGAGIGLQGLQTALTSAGQMNAIGNSAYNQQMGINALQNQYGTQQQANTQAILNQQYADFQNQQKYPYQQMAYMSDMLRGLPMSQTSAQMYQAAPSATQQIMGAGTALYGASKLAKGGRVPAAKRAPKRDAGLMDLALTKMA